MPEPNLPPSQPVVVTGSSGFIGSHLCAKLSDSQPAGSVLGVDVESPSRPSAYTHTTADIRVPDRLVQIGEWAGAPPVTYHLAASAEVLTPWDEVPELLSSNHEGTYNVLRALTPALVVFASSSSVYGDSGPRPAHPQHAPVRPISLYAVSKLAGEMLLRDWVNESNKCAIVFRFGNVVGTGCRGLIRYLTNHIVKYPDGGVVARLRGEGRLMRDYVPVSYVVEVMTSLAQKPWEQGTLLTLNLGTGRAMSNREVAEIVRATAHALGFRLDLRFDDPAGIGEAREVVLDVDDTVGWCGIAPPSPEEVRQTIVAAVCQSLHPYASPCHARTVSA
jgi:nucleoside-diphosphate-sugar epimerase